MVHSKRILFAVSSLSAYFVPNTVLEMQMYYLEQIRCWTTETTWHTKYSVQRMELAYWICLINNTR